ncbi:MAG: hypothetical protein IJH91_08265 [Mogibacterium sp.]|nr:hypothetical protein [Mogibacterium sp.]
MKTVDEINEELKQCDAAKVAHIIYDEAERKALQESAEDPADRAVLERIDTLFGAADLISIENAVKHQRILMALAAAATLLTISFLLYDEAMLYWLIFGCGVLIFCLFAIRRIASQLDCHRKYLEYRVLAESLRVQYFLRYAGTRIRVTDLLPWSLRMGMPWLTRALNDVVTPPDIETREEQEDEALEDEASGDEPILPAAAPVRHSILDCWILDQKRYHERALIRTQVKDQRNDRISRIVLIVTIIAYFVTLGFEIHVYRVHGNADPVSFEANEHVRSILKIILGSLSATTLFSGNYYGKMSLGNTINDHKRMIALLSSVEHRIEEEGETEDLLIDLARESLSENSTWYAYQSMNSPEISL